MHASKDRPGAGLRRANDDAYRAPIALIAEAQASGDIVASDPDRPVGPLVSGTIATLVDGLRPR